MRDWQLTVFLSGDVMTGRGIDQILPHAGDPELREPMVQDARRYVELAEAVSGSVHRPVDFSWPWGDALPLLDEAAPDVRVLNVETSVTRSDDFAVGKAVHYRMSPANLPCLAASRPDACALANNHVLDFGRSGLLDTLQLLEEAGLRPVGAGRDRDEARRPAIIPVRGRRVLVFSMGTRSSGIPRSWAAGAGPGVDLLPDLSALRVADVSGRVQRVKRPGDLAVASIHLGSNWGYDVPEEHVLFAHGLVEGGVDIVHGHSSHHPRPIEVYRGRLILYGCGGLIDDYEGIGSPAEYRADLRLLYFATLDATTGRLLELRMAPLKVNRMRLRTASAADRGWLRSVLDDASRPLGSRVALDEAGMLTLRWPGTH